MWAIVIQASAEATDFSQSFASRRHLPSHAKVRSTTQRHCTVVKGGKSLGIIRHWHPVVAM